MPTSASSRPANALLLFARHGATAPNLAGLRCGGDLDVPLTPEGRLQAARLASAVAMLEPRVGMIITADLIRTRETTAIVLDALGDLPLLVEPAFRERRLGRWNLLPLDETQPLLAARQTPPQGEAHDDFRLRIADALQSIVPHLPRRPLLIASKGVARVLGELTGDGPRRSLGNGELTEFNFAALATAETAGTRA